MVFTTQEAEQLYQAGKYRELVSQWERWVEERRPQDLDENILGALVKAGVLALRAAWAYYQLGAFEKAEKLARILRSATSADVPAGESARRLLAHCSERQGRLEDAEAYLRDIPASRERDNLYLTILIARKRQGKETGVIVALNLVTEAMIRTPYQTIDGHIINNAAWLLYEAREEEAVKPFLPILVGLIESAIGIYEATGTALNHRAGALFRASHICLDVADWPKGALLDIDESITLWEQLVASEGGDRYQKNLERARAQREKILARLS